MDETISLLTELAKEAEGCRACALGEVRRERKGKSVFSDGNPHADVMIVGEGPGEQEELQGRPFVGPAGELLTKMLGAINLDRKNDVYICNVIRCRAFEIVDGRVKNRPPRTDEANACAKFLDEQIRIVNPRLILATGAPAAKALLNQPGFRITEGRGKWYAGPLGVPVMVTYHPAYLLRLTDPKSSNEKRLVWSDLKEFRRRLDEPTFEAPMIETPKPRTIVEQMTLI